MTAAHYIQILFISLLISVLSCWSGHVMSVFSKIWISNLSFFFFSLHPLIVPVGLWNVSKSKTFFLVLDGVWKDYIPCQVLLLSVSPLRRSALSIVLVIIVTESHGKIQNFALASELVSPMRDFPLFLFCPQLSCRGYPLLWGSSHFLLCLKDRFPNVTQMAGIPTGV